MRFEHPSPSCRAHYPGGPNRRMRRSLPGSRGLPRLSGGSASATSLSRPAQAYCALGPNGLLARPCRTLSRGFSAALRRTTLLASFDVGRHLPRRGLSRRRAFAPVRRTENFGLVVEPQVGLLALKVLLDVKATSAQAQAAGRRRRALEPSHVRMVRRGVAVGPIHDQPRLRPVARPPVEVARQIHRQIRDAGLMLGLIGGPPTDPMPLPCVDPPAVLPRGTRRGLARGSDSDAISPLATTTSTLTWRLACFPTAPQYWCATPTDLTPCFSQPVSPMIQAYNGSMSSRS